LHVASALQHMHGKQLVHADVKPANVLVDKRSTSWTVRLADLGLACEVGVGAYVQVIVRGFVWCPAHGVKPPFGAFLPSQTTQAAAGGHTSPARPPQPSPAHNSQAQPSPQQPSPYQSSQVPPSQAHNGPAQPRPAQPSRDQPSSAQPSPCSCNVRTVHMDVHISGARRWPRLP
jgi:serine/threonine protein kinase